MWNVISSRRTCRRWVTRNPVLGHCAQRHVWDGESAQRHRLAVSYCAVSDRGEVRTSQVFSLKQNQTYNAKMIPVRLRDHIFYTLFALSASEGGDGADSGERRRGWVVAGPTARAISDHILSRSRHLRRQPMCRSVIAPMPSKRQDLFRRRIVHVVICPIVFRRHSVYGNMTRSEEKR